MSRRVSYSLVLLSCLWSRTTVSAATHGLDFSHQFSLTPTAISVISRNFVESIFDSGSEDEVGNFSNVTIDVSNSNLGDKGLEQIVSSIGACQRKLTNCSVTLDMYFKAQMNGLSSKGMAKFLNQILNSNVSTNIPNTTSTSSVDSQVEPIKWRSLDFGWNPLYGSPNNHKPFHTAIYNLLSRYHDEMRGFNSLCLSCTGLGPTACRIISKGILSRVDRPEDDDNSIKSFTPLSLYLSYNRGIGDAGAAAFAALIRSFAGKETEAPILDTLDLSSCDIGDVGVEALALALEDASASVMIRNLLLCHNRISDQGALSLGRALHRNILGKEMHVDLSGNPLISDQGILTLLSAFEKECLTGLKLRSCSIQADGMMQIGKMLRSIALSKNRHSRNLYLDISGNPVGILRGKSEKNSLYSASALKSKASATASAYMSQGLSFLKKGFGGVSIRSSVESDDEEEKKQSPSYNSKDDSDKPKNMRCGFKSLANAFLEGDTHDVMQDDNSSKKRVCLGLRRTFCDSAGADALAAMLVATKDCFVNMWLDLELDLNPVVEDEMINALHGRNDDLLVEMAERHTEAMEVLRLSRERAVVASSAVSARPKKVPSTLGNFEVDVGADPENFNFMYESVLDMDSIGADSDAEYEDELEDY
jgi:Leucine Rich repeat